MFKWLQKWLGEPVSRSPESITIRSGSITPEQREKFDYMVDRFNRDMDNFVIMDSPIVEWINGEECTYPGCFGDDKKLYFCGMVPKPCGLNNACVTDDEGHCIPVRLSGLVKKEMV